MLFLLFLTVPWIVLIYGIFSVLWGIVAKVTGEAQMTGLLLVKLVPVVGGLACIFMAAWTMGWF